MFDKKKIHYTWFRWLQGCMHYKLGGKWVSWCILLQGSRLWSFCQLVIKSGVSAENRSELDLVLKNWRFAGWWGMPPLLDHFQILCIWSRVPNWIFYVSKLYSSSKDRFSELAFGTHQEQHGFSIWQQNGPKSFSCTETLIKHEMCKIAWDLSKPWVLKQSSRFSDVCSCWLQHYITANMVSIATQSVWSVDRIQGMFFFFFFYPKINTTPDVYFMDSNWLEIFATSSLH